MPILLTLAALALGVLVAIEPAMNAQLGKSLGHPVYGSLANFAVGLLALVVLMAVVLRPAVPRAAELAATPWWAWLGGLLGAVFVTAAVLLVPRIGIVLFVSALLCGQLLSAAVLDQLALAGLSHRPLTPARVAGLVFLLIGLALVHFGTDRPVPIAAGVAGAMPAPTEGENPPQALREG